MAYSDSMDKIVGTYFAAVTKEPFTYKNKFYKPKKLYVSPQFFNEYTCKMGCAGCCSSAFSLDYLPEDPRPKDLINKTFQINDIKVPIFTTYNKPDPNQRFCKFVDLKSGACTIHGEHPFSCDFETLRFVHYEDRSWLGVRTYGRGWAMMRVDGERGAICEFPKVSNEEARLEGIRKLKRLQQWTDSAKLETWIPQIIEWAKEIQYQPLILEK